MLFKSEISRPIKTGKIYIADKDIFIPIRVQEWDIDEDEQPECNYL
jgi:hypothetical protein